MPFQATSPRRPPPRPHPARPFLLPASLPLLREQVLQSEGKDLSGVDPTLDEGIHLLEELERVQNHTVPEEAAGARMEDAGRNLVENELLGADMHRVTRVRSALIARHDVDILAQKVDNLSFAFISPLRAYDYGRRRSVQNTSLWNRDGTLLAPQDANVG